MEKKELVQKILTILMSEISDVDKLIDIYILVDTESKTIEKTEKEYSDTFEKLIKEFQEKVNKEKFGKSDSTCLIDRFIEKSGDRYKGQPIMLYCGCKKCKPC